VVVLAAKLERGAAAFKETPPGAPDSLVEGALPSSGTPVGAQLLALTHGQTVLTKRDGGIVEEGQGVDGRLLDGRDGGHTNAPGPGAWQGSGVDDRSRALVGRENELRDIHDASADHVFDRRWHDTNTAHNRHSDERTTG
jgi:hypothetical protein